MDYEGYGIIYKIVNNVNNKVYIGLTRSEFNRRYSGGKWWLYTHNKHLKYSAIYHGVDNFHCVILKVCNDEEELLSSEKKFILESQATEPEKGYNILEGGESGVLSEEVKARIREKVKAKFQDTEFAAMHSESISLWWNSLSEKKLNQILEKRAKTKNNLAWREYLSEKIIVGHAKRTAESKANQYLNAEATRNSRNLVTVKAMYAARAEKRKATWAAMSLEELEAKLKAKNKKIKETLLARDDDYEARVAKRLSRSPEERELSEVKRILDRFGPSWQPGGRSKWFSSMDKFHSLVASLAASTSAPVPLKPIVIVVAGQSGVGKSWVCSQLTSCGYVSYDKARERSYELIERAVALYPVVVFETPIGSKSHVKNLSERYQVYYAVVLSDEQVVVKQLEGRGSTRLSNVAKMNVKYKKYAAAASFAGSSSWMLTQLQELIDGEECSSLCASQV